MTREVWWAGLPVDEEISKLQAFSEAIRKGRGGADAEFEARAEALGGQQALNEHEYNSFADDAYLIAETERVMCANLAVSVNSCVENFLKTVSEEIGVPEDERCNVPTMWRSVSERLGFDTASIPGFGDADKARILGNLFKHNSGKKDTRFVKQYGGTEDEEIEYEREAWPTIIASTRELLHGVVRAQEQRDPPQPPDDLAQLG